MFLHRMHKEQSGFEPRRRRLIYIRPLYLRAAGGRISELKRVIVAHQNQIVMEETTLNVWATGVAMVTKFEALATYSNRHPDGREASD